MTATLRYPATSELGTSLSRVVSLPSGLSQLFRAAERLSCTPNLVGEQLRAIRRSREHCAAVARNAYWHSNGFAKVKVAETLDRCLRLHIWPAGDNRLGDGNPHGHRWEFASWVAVGAGMKEQRLRKPQDAMDGLPYTRCNYTRKDGISFLEPVETVTLQAEPVMERKPGHVYGCGLDVIHTVAPIGTELVATVFLQGPILREATDVYRLPGQLIEDRQSPISPAELDRLLAQVEDAIEASPEEPVVR